MITDKNVLNLLVNACGLDQNTAENLTLEEALVHVDSLRAEVGRVFNKLLHRGPLWVCMYSELGGLVSEITEFETWARDMGVEYVDRSNGEADIFEIHFEHIPDENPSGDDILQELIDIKKSHSWHFDYIVLQ